MYALSQTSGTSQSNRLSADYMNHAELNMSMSACVCVCVSSLPLRATIYLVLNFKDAGGWSAAQKSPANEDTSVYAV